ncbi:transcriptional regulator [uncultured Clostridium sp.]|uniref:transcriptional regulator n=1 Tax=uncultured Clostridium sp. TaxID=59620 RepID=UPI002590500E|nr:transcriptional regulator [uncultured Clostridium sp.]
MDKELYKKVENKLYQYYEEKSYRERLKNKVAILEKQIEQIEDQMKNIHNYVHLDYYQAGTGIGPGIQGNSDNSSYFEKEMIREVTKLQKEKANKIKNKIKTENRIMNTELFISSMNNIIKEMDDEDKEYLIYRYRKKYSDIQISVLMNYSNATASRRRKSILEYLIKVIFMKKVV